MTIQNHLSMTDYLVLDALSSGAAFRAVTQSPLHARHYQLTASTNSKVADIGTIAHQILLEGCEDCVVLVDADSWRTKDAQTARDEARANGQSPILAHQIHEIRAMVDAAKTFIETSELKGVLGTGHAEVSVTWVEEGMTFCKARPDYLTDDFHISVKTTSASANPAIFSRRLLASAGYDFSLAFYARGLKKNGIDVKHRILVIEQNPPYGCSVISLAHSKQSVCNSMVSQSIRLWRECQRRDFYPGYPSDTWEADALPWELDNMGDEGINYLLGGSQ